VALDSPPVIAITSAIWIVPAACSCHVENPDENRKMRRYFPFFFHSSVLSTIRCPGHIRSPGASALFFPISTCPRAGHIRKGPLFVLLTPRQSSQVPELATEGPTTSKCMLFISSPRASSHLPTRSNSTDTNDATSKPMSTKTFVAALVLNGAIAGVEIAVFTLVRRYFPFIYEPRSLSVFGAYACPLALPCHRLTFV
jgi:hypothetical protein